MTDDTEYLLENPDVFHQLVTQAKNGDTSTVPMLRELMTTTPGLSAQVGDAFSHVEQKALGRISKQNLLQQEAYRSSLNSLEQSLQTDPRHVELALIKQIRMDLLLLSQAEERLIDYPTEANNTLVNSAHKRALASLKTLHMIQRVLPPVQINIAENQINIS
jgi:hypothetical protein